MPELSLFANMSKGIDLPWHSVGEYNEEGETTTMSIQIDLPPTVEARLRAKFPSLDEVAKLGMAVEAYRAGQLSIGQFAELLGISQHEADGILKARKIWLEYSDEELAAERETLRRLSGS